MTWGERRGCKESRKERNKQRKQVVKRREKRRRKIQEQLSVFEIPPAANENQKHHPAAN